MTITNNTEASLIESVKFYFPHFLNPKKTGSVIRNFITTIAYAFNFNTKQLNEMFTNTFISEAEGDELTELIMDISKIKRKNGESDADYRTRYKKYAYEYNITQGQVENIVYDITGTLPTKITEGNSRGFYWGTPNNEAVGTVIDTRYYYEDVGVHTPLWGNDGIIEDLAFTAYIYLNERPSSNILDELIDVIESVRMKGTAIYLVLPIPEYRIFEWYNSTGSGDFETLINSPDNKALIVNDERIFEYNMNGELTHTILDSTSNANHMNIRQLVDESTIFSWFMSDLFLTDLTTHGNNGVIIALAITDILLRVLPSTNSFPISDLEANHNDMIYQDSGDDPTTLVLWELVS